MKLPKIEWVTDQIYTELFGYNRKSLLLTAKHSSLFPKDETDIDESIRDCMNEKALDALQQMEGELTAYFKRSKAIGFSEIFAVIRQKALHIRGEYPMSDIWLDNDNIDIMY